MSVLYLITDGPHFMWFKYGVVSGSSYVHPSECQQSLCFWLGAAGDPDNS